MLEAHEFFVGHVGDAKGLTFVRPRETDEYSMLVSEASGQLTAVFLHGRFSFTSFQCVGNTSWGGILVPDVRIEVDENAIDAEEGYSAPAGTVVRKDTGLYVKTRNDRGMRTPDLALVAGLPSCTEAMAATFTKWRIVIGERHTLRELMCVDRRAAVPTII